MNTEKLLIHSPRLLIRNLRLTDLEAFHAYRSNPRVTRYQGFDTMTLEQARDFIGAQQDRSYGRLGQWVQYGIELATTKEFIGDCAIRLNADDSRIAAVGITISPLHQQKGYARETLRAILAFLFDSQGLHRVVETVDAGNTPSIRLLESLGFRREGYFVENVFFKGEWGSEYQYALLAREWKNRS